MTNRLFVALPLPADVLRRACILHGVLAQVDGGRMVRWVRPEGLHITVAFVGNVEDTLTERVSQAVAEAAAASRATACTLAFGPITVIPTQERPQVVWIAIDDVDGGAARLAADTRLSLRAQGIAIADAAFRPHVTLGRVRHGAGAFTVRSLGDNPQTAAGALPRHVGVSEGDSQPTWQPDRIEVWVSTLGAGGSRYEVVSSHRFGEHAGRARTISDVRTTKSSRPRGE